MIKINTLVIFAFALVVLTTNSCKKIGYDLISETIADGFQTDLERAAGLPCSDIDDLPTYEENDLSFNPEHVLCINIDMDESSFQRMKAESRFGPSITQEGGVAVTSAFLELLRQCDVPWPSHFNWYSTTIRVDDEVVTNVGIRKKGFMGSIFGIAPSVKLQLDRFDSDQKLAETKSITLNNNVEDVSRIRTVFAMKVFELAGEIAPRANLANVSMNSNFYGAYTRLEAVDERFLDYHFNNASGDLYEGQIADFKSEWLPRWAAKTDVTDRQLSPLRNIIRILEQKSDEDLIAALDVYIDVDKFTRFWALEIILQHIDGYTSNGNNFFVYFDPMDRNRATFIPWGINYFVSEDVRNDWNVFVKAELPRRLSRIEASRNLLRNNIENILDDVWDEPELEQFIRTMGDQVTQVQEDPFYDSYIEEFVLWMKSRDDFVMNMLSEGLPMGQVNTRDTCWD